MVLEAYKEIQEDFMSLKITELLRRNEKRKHIITISSLKGPTRVKPHNKRELFIKQTRQCITFKIPLQPLYG